MSQPKPKPRILFFNPVRHALADYEALHAVASPEVVTSTSRRELFDDLKAKYHDIQAIYRTSASGAVAGNFDEELISHLPPSLKFICHTGAGYDQIDVDACSRHGITVTYAPDPVTNATADLALFLLLGAIRQLNPSFSSLRNGNFKKGLDFGHDPQGKTLGILGMGRIGRAVKRRAEPFGLKVVYHNRTPLSDELAAGCPYVSFDELLETSDIISVHVPLSAATKHLIGAAEIAKMRRGVVLINTARGAVIDEGAMAEALDAGHIAAVGLDVYEREPLVDERLVKNERALLVPHLGTHTVETLRQMESLAMENARRGVCGEALLTIVPEQVETRARKHKCSGERPKCAQCGINNVACQWPEQRKRGPPKHYITTMEKRLMETENVLCALLNQVSEEQLASAFPCQAGDYPAPQVGGKDFELVKSRQFGPVHWGHYPLDSAQHVKRWWKARSSMVSTDAGSQQSQSVDGATEDNQAARDSRDGSYDDDFEPTEERVVVEDGIEPTGSLRALANGESQFVGSSSGVYFINTVKRAFATPDATAADTNQHAATGVEPSDDPSPEDCIVGGGEDADITAPGSRPEHEETATTSGQSDDHVISSPFSSTGRDFMDGMNNLPDYSVARELVLAYFRIWHPLVPFLQGPDCLAELESLYHSNSRPGSHKSSSVSLLVTFRCIFNIARLEKDGPVDMGSTAIRSPSDLLPVLSVLALRCDTASIQALLCAQVYFISTMSLRHASSVSGLISKSIFQSGMYRCPVRYEHLSPDERSMRKRIFWSFYVLDRFVSQSLGHPNGIQDSDIDVCPPGQRDLHEPVVKSGLSPGSADDTTLHLPSNHPGRVATPSAGQTQGRDPSPETESEQEDQEQDPGAAAAAAQMPAGDESRRSAAIVRHRRETQAVLENHVRHSKLVGRVLEVFHKSIHARHLDNQTVLFLKADVSAFGNGLTQPRLGRVASDMPSLTPDPTVFPFVSYHYTVLLLNRPSLSLEPGRAEFQEALQTCIAAAKVIIQTIRRYAEHGGPLFWPGYMSAVWMSGLVLALAARLKLYNKSKAKSAVHVALELLTTMTGRWAMARHCKEKRTREAAVLAVVPSNNNNNITASKVP
ncbi:putative 2-hydroxyacid dehydrogenase UNK4.10 [Colletotrichum higginsianum]|uniref:Putative 2-hydroxyacid dehydrogenase UNK4.10 n=1 Tax=Colletotrichum higginsianum TaxID=80884 RepID=A0A4V4NDH2_9PEZI|nr:putative 2-hydroxyacid dehydrogenase UNK4.10 [Colletotrichum higginsianum]